MENTRRQGGYNLALLLIGVICNASIVPFMSVYLVEGLEQPPWIITVFSAAMTLVALYCNRSFGERIDQGARIARLVLLCIAAYLAAMLALLFIEANIWLLIALVSLCLGLSTAVVATMYSFGRLYAERAQFDIPRYNSYLRTMTSLGWMIAPALAFVLAGQFTFRVVFLWGLSAAMIWLVMWWCLMPKQFCAEPVSSKAEDEQGAANSELYLAAAVCFCFALAHILCTNALPLFYIRELGLPTYAPGLSFSVKTAMEVVAILSVPNLLKRFGAPKLLLTSGLLSLVAFNLLASVTSLSQLVVGAALEGLYYGCFAAAGLSYVQDFARGRMARATSLYMNSLVAGSLVAGSSMGLIAQWWSFQSSIYAAGIGSLAALLLLLFCWQQGKRTIKKA